MVDCHVHTRFSGDSETNENVACEIAINRGYKGIAFTDHYDPDYPVQDAGIFLLDFENYVPTMMETKEKYEGKLEVVMGIEVGLEEHTIEESNDKLNFYQFDFVIASLHVVNRLDLHNGDFTRGKTKEEAYLTYFKELNKLLNIYNNYDVVGHIDFIRRYGNYENKILKYSDYNDVLDSTLKTIIEKGKGIEINTSGWRYNLDSSCPGLEIIKRYKDLGGEILCFSSDAHKPEHIGYKFETAVELAKQCGFKHATYFINRQPVFYKI